MWNVRLPKITSRFLLLLTLAVLSSCEGVTVRSVASAQKAAIPFTHHFDFNSASGYTADPTLMFTANRCELRPSDFTDDDNDATGGFGAGVMTGVAYGALSAAGSGLKLGSAGGCDATTTNCNELDSTWMPHSSALLGLWHLNDSSPIHNGSITGVGSIPLVAKNANGTGLASENGRLKNAIRLDGVDDYLTAGVQNSLDFTNGFAISLWYYNDGGPAIKSLFKCYDSSSNPGIALWIDDNWVPYIGSYLRGASGSRNLDTYYHFLNTGARWHHVVLTWDDTDPVARFYFDGVEHASGSMTGPPQCSTSGEFMLGENLGGKMDEVAIWNEGLSATEVQSIFEHQSAVHGGRVLSRVLAAPAAQTWTQLNWKPLLPYRKALPDNAAQEVSTDYPGMVGSTGMVGDNNLMSGIWGLWHFDETGLGTGPGGTDYIDSSGNGRHFNAVNNSNVAYGLGGIINQSAGFGQNGGNGYARSNTSPTYAGAFTFSGWFNTSWVGGGDHTLVGVGGSFAYGLEIHYDNAGQLYIEVGDGTANLAFHTEPSFAYGQWHHVAVAVSTSDMRVFIDGVKINTYPFSGTPLLADSSHVLEFGWGSGIWRGQADEFAIWTRALHDNEVKQLYVRQLSNVKFQVRTCTLNDCSDDPNGRNWKGPDGTSGSFFSDVYNRATMSAAPSGSYRASGPSMILGNFTSPPAASRYLQYKAVLESNGTTSAHFPELKSVTLAPAPYDTSAPRVTTLSGPAFRTLASISETATCPGSVVYQLSTNSTLWYYWNGSAWVLSSGTAAQANSIAVLNAHLTSFPTQVGIGTLYVRARLQSSGSAACALDDLAIVGER